MALNFLGKARIIAGVLFLFTAAAYSEPDSHRFDPLLKTSWYGVYMQGGKVGYANISLEKSPNPIESWIHSTSIVLKLSMAADSASMKIDDQRAYKRPGGELYSSVMRISSPTGNLEVNGRIEEGVFAITTNMGGQKTELTFPYPLDYLDSMLCLEMRVASGRLKPGDILNFPTYEATPPLTGLVHQSVKIAGVEEFLFGGVPTDVIVADITLREAMMTARSKLDRYGNMLEGSFGGAMVLKLETEEEAKRLDHSFDILKDNLVKIDTALGDPGSLTNLGLTIRGVDSSSLITTNMQVIKLNADNSLSISLSRQTSPALGVKRPIEEAEMKPYLISEPYLQSDNPKITELAEQIVGNETDSWEAAKVINRWVFENLEKRFTPDFSNALQTLNSRRGDCGEHTVLAVALLRAAGIPARPIFGLMYWPPADGFGYHAWVEAYVRDWVQMDPTWNEELANPAHIAIGRGNIIDQVGSLLKTMGNIKIEVESAN
jgi:hypothetical protein